MDKEAFEHCDELDDEPLELPPDGPDRRVHLHRSIDAGAIAVGDVIPLVVESITNYFIDHYEIISGRVVTVTEDLIECTVVGEVLSKEICGLTDGDIVPVARHYQTTVAEQLPSDDDMDGVVVTVDRCDQEYRAHAAVAADAEFTSTYVDWED